MQFQITKLGKNVSSSKKRPSLSSCPFTYQHKCLWCHKQLLMQHAGKSVTNPKSLGSFFFKLYQQESTSKHWTTQQQHKEGKDSEWPGIKIETFSFSGKIVLELLNLLAKPHAKGVLQALNLYLALLYPQPLILTHIPFLSLCQYKYLCDRGVNYTRELIQWRIKLAKQLLSLRERFSHQAESMLVPAKGREKCAVRGRRKAVKPLLPSAYAYTDCETTT